MPRYRAPKEIADHPGVQECSDAFANGAPGYRHDVFLKEGWAFRNGRMAGCRSGLFCSVAEFRDAKPFRIPSRGLKS
jgi:hypothetical protein